MSWREKLFKYLAKLKNTLLSKPLQQESGAIITLTALLIPLMLSMMGIGYDVGNLYMHKARLQNMADAAALAGGKEYLDKLDVSEEGGTVQDGETIDNHPNTDQVAKNYVTKNSINLPNSTISHDFNSLKVRLSNTDGKTPYFRVGLQEYVNLHFLPIISGLPKSQLVRAEGIAVLVKGTPGTGTGSGTSTVTVTNPSIFDNLFTYSKSFESGLSNANNLVNAIYKGNMVFTNGNGEGTDSNFYDMESVLANSGENIDTKQSSAEHLFDDSSVSVEAIKKNFNNSHWSKVNDPIIDTYFKTTDYIDALTSWLAEPHIEITDNNKNNLSSGEINDKNSSLYLTEITVDGHPVRVHNGNFYYIETNNSSEYFAFNTTTDTYKYLSGSEQTENNRIRYIQYFDTYNNKKYFTCIKRDDKYYLLDNNGNVTTSYLQNGTLNGQEYNAIDFNMFGGTNDPKYKKRIETNIIHFNNSVQLDVNFNNAIDKVFSSDKDSTPVYIIIEKTVRLGNLNFSNSGRPIVFVYLGESNIQLQSGNFNGIIYAPKADIYINLTGTFTGSIIAENITMQASGGVGSQWIQKNYLENSDYTDKYVAKKTLEIENSIKTAAKLTDDIKTIVMQRYASDLHKNLSDMDDPLFYSKLNYSEKQTLYNTWKSLLNSYPQYANQLWPWNEHFDIQTGEEETPGTPDNIRLINPRIEANPFSIGL